MAVATTEINMQYSKLYHQAVVLVESIKVILNYNIKQENDLIYS